MDIKRCSDVNLLDVVEAFNLGFSDYVIQHVWEVQEFSSRFFGTEGNRPEYSFIAYVDEKPVGVILGGIREYDGRLTLRCGALCVGPEHRATGVAHQLFEHHVKVGSEMGCRQLFLEVLKGNERAIAFYEKKGYEKIYNLAYYSHTVESLKRQVRSKAQESKQINFKSEAICYKTADIQVLKAFRAGLSDCHMNWQCEPECFDGTNAGHILGAYRDDEVVGMAAMGSSGKVYFLWVQPQYRSCGIATSLVLKLAELGDVEKLHFSTSNHAGVMGYLKNKGFQREAIEQFEMYRVLP